MVDVAVVGKIYSWVKPEFLLSRIYLELGNNTENGCYLYINIWPPDKKVG